MLYLENRMNLDLEYVSIVCEKRLFLISQVDLVQRIPCTRLLLKMAVQDRKDRRTQNHHWRPLDPKSRPRTIPITRIIRIITKDITCSLMV